MRQVYIVTYDVRDSKRLRKVYRMMRGYGDHLQLSVFRCTLSTRELAELRRRLEPLLKSSEDQVLFVNIGPADGRGRTSMFTMGRPLPPLDDLVKVF